MPFPHTQCLLSSTNGLSQRSLPLVYTLLSYREMEHFLSPSHYSLANDLNKYKSRDSLTSVSEHGQQSFPLVYTPQSTHQEIEHCLSASLYTHTIYLRRGLVRTAFTFVCTPQVTCEEIAHCLTLSIYSYSVCLTNVCVRITVLPHVHVCTSATLTVSRLQRRTRLTSIAKQF